MMKMPAALALTMVIAAGVQALDGSDGSRVRTTIFRGAEMPYEVVNGLAVYAGDIILGTVEEVAA